MPSRSRTVAPANLRGTWTVLPTHSGATVPASNRLPLLPELSTTQLARLTSPRGLRPDDVHGGPAAHRIDVDGHGAAEHGLEQLTAQHLARRAHANHAPAREQQQ